VAPVANQGENQKQYRDNQNASGFQSVDGQLGMRFGITVRRLRFWLRGGHDDIVAPELEQDLSRENASVEHVVKV
jgi:hypothetical protein